MSTPSWPASGSKFHPRKNNGNTLGCVEDDNVSASQNFFALKLSKADVISVANALVNASVVTDQNNLQIVSNGRPVEVQALISSLGKKSKSHSVLKTKLSSNVILISKPSDLHVPPWQLVSAELDGTNLRTATWWHDPYVYSSNASTAITCWDSSLPKSGEVSIATSGQWGSTDFNLK